VEIAGWQITTNAKRLPRSIEKIITLIIKYDRGEIGREELEQQANKIAQKAGYKLHGLKRMIEEYLSAANEGRVLWLGIDPGERGYRTYELYIDPSRKKIEFEVHVW